MTFLINPCQAIDKKFGKNGADINTINNMCYDICEAYGNPKGCSEQCASMLSAKKISMGKSDCSLRIPRPPIWNQIPHNFPALLQKTGNIEQAYKECCSMSKNSYYPNTSKEICKLDADAIVTPTVETFSSDYAVDYGNEKKIPVQKQEQKNQRNLLSTFVGLLLLSTFVGLLLLFSFFLFKFFYLK